MDVSYKPKRVTLSRSIDLVHIYSNREEAVQMDADK